MSLLLKLMQTGGPEPSTSRRNFLRGLPRDLAEDALIVNTLMTLNSSPAEAKEPSQLLPVVGNDEYMSNYNNLELFAKMAKVYVREFLPQQHPQNQTLNILYPGSGCHLAPLEIALRVLEESELQKVCLTYTEINDFLAQGASPEDQGLVSALLELKKDQRFKNFKMKNMGSEQIIPPEEIAGIINDPKDQQGRVKSSETKFSFDYVTSPGKVKTIELYFELRRSGANYFRQEFYDQADLVISHSPGNLPQFASDVLKAGSATVVKKPRVFITEDTSVNSKEEDFYAPLVQGNTKSTKFEQSGYGHVSQYKPVIFLKP